MEKICEFCTELRPLVYCKADAANLCLSCDARVHSANALSGRHFRTLLCQSCRNRPAYVRCMNHEMFICRNCDRTLHGFSSQHQKRLLKTYVGCPSPEDFAFLWGFDLNLLDNCGNGDRFVFSSTGSAVKGMLDLKSLNQYSPTTNGPSAGYSKASSGSSSQQRRMNQRADPHQDNNDIMQQIIGLKRFQLTEQSHNPSQLRGKEQAEFLSTVSETSRRLEENLDDLGSLQFPDISNDIQAMDISRHGLKEEPCSSPFSQLEHLAPPATVGTRTSGDTLWQWKSPVFDSQLWSEQNMQDLGFCEEFDCFDDIPDVDPTFRSFEDLFGANQDPTRPLIDSENMFSAFEITSQDFSDDECAKSLEVASASSSDAYAHQSRPNKATSPLGQVKHTQATVESPNFFSRQLALSRLSTKCSFNDIEGDMQEDGGVSPMLTTKGEASNSGTPDSDGTHAYSPRFKDTKKTRMREKAKQTRYSPRAADLKKRVKSNFTKPESHRTKSISSSQSY